MFSSSGYKTQCVQRGAEMTPRKGNACNFVSVPSHRCRIVPAVIDSASRPQGMWALLSLALQLVQPERQKWSEYSENLLRVGTHYLYCMKALPARLHFFLHDVIKSDMVDATAVVTEISGHKSRVLTHLLKLGLSEIIY